MFKTLLFLYSFLHIQTLMTGCESANSKKVIDQTVASDPEVPVPIVPGAERTELYMHLLKGRKIGLVVNQTSLIRNVHLVDSLLRSGIDIKVIFSPEHGFRGTADAGEKISDSKDGQTGLTIVSLYGNKRKPRPEDLRNVDMLVFDIQDVGVRFYTYISTLHYVMEAAAENDIPLIVLDRPNPNGHYIDGPVLEPAFRSFVGMHPVPVVYGMTIGEYALMINGEKWLNGAVRCRLDVISCKDYMHDSMYDLPVKPSPNLPNLRSILLYPSLCLFEGTTLSVGRGTDRQFQILGHPEIKSDFSFTPSPNEGAKDPVWNGTKCYGTDFTGIPVEPLFQTKKLDLKYLIRYYRELTSKGDKYFLDNLFFDKLAGTDKLRKQIIEGLKEEQIRASWQQDIEKFKKIRQKYLLYP